MLVQELAAKVENVLAPNHRDHVGRFEHQLFLLCIGSRLQFEAAASGYIDFREFVRFGKQQSQLGRVSFAERFRYVAVCLL